MPAIVGVVQVIAIGTGSVFHIGEFLEYRLILMPKPLLEQVLSTQGMK